MQRNRGGRRARTGWVLVALALAATSAAPVATASAAPEVGPASAADAFAYAFRFASSIETDDKDRSMAEASVVLTVALAGGLDRAVSMADDVDGWRQGTAWADLAVMLAKVGRIDEARALIARADEVRARTEGWQNGRIEAHIAQALAYVGDDARAREISARLATGDIQYAGRGVATVASAHAARGDFDEAIKALATLDAEADYEVTWWRTLGYLEIAGRETFSREQRRAAFDAALRSAASIPGWKRGEALQRVAEDLTAFGDTDGARAALAAAEEAIAGMPDSTPVKGPLYSDLARTWAAAGDTERAFALLERAKTAIGGAMVIERPAIYAEIGAGFLAAGDAGRAREFYASALARAEALVNARPRALAATAICASMGRHGMPVDDATRARLDRLIAGLRAPW